MGLVMRGVRVREGPLGSLPRRRKAGDAPGGWPGGVGTQARQEGQCRSLYGIGEEHLLAFGRKSRDSQERAKDAEQLLGRKEDPVRDRCLSGACTCLGAPTFQKAGQKENFYFFFFWQGWGGKFCFILN